MVTAALDEQTVASIWERQSFDQDSLSQLGVTVVFRGLPSDAGGPDYQDAILARTNGTLMHGDVEFHVRATDWYRHGHHRNPRYNSVILHVVWTCDNAETRTQAGGLIPVLALGAEDNKPQRFASGRPLESLPPHPCIACFSRLGTDDMRETIRWLGLQRFNHRRDVFGSDLTAQSSDQVVYRALLEAMGYASNRQAFRMLADAVPYSWLLSLRSEDRLPCLLEAAGLGPAHRAHPPAHLEAGAWRLNRLRPTNHPALRLRGVVQLLGSLEPSVSRSLLSVVDAAERPSDLRRRLVTRDGASGLIGAGRADELAVSVVLPFVSALVPSGDTARALFARYPSPPSTRWTRFMLELLSRAGHEVGPVKGALEHQGLHHLYHAYCRHSRRHDCPVCAGMRLDGIER